MQSFRVSRSFPVILVALVSSTLVLGFIAQTTGSLSNSVKERQVLSRIHADSLLNQGALPGIEGNDDEESFVSDTQNDNPVDATLSQSDKDSNPSGQSEQRTAGGNTVKFMSFMIFMAGGALYVLWKLFNRPRILFRVSKMRSRFEQPASSMV